MKERLLSQRDAGEGLRVELLHLTSQTMQTISQIIQTLACCRKFNADLVAQLQNLQLDHIDAGGQLFQAFHFFFENLHPAVQRRWRHAWLCRRKMRDACPDGRR